MIESIISMELPAGGHLGGSQEPDLSKAGDETVPPDQPGLRYPRR